MTDKEIQKLKESYFECRTGCFQNQITDLEYLEIVKKEYQSRNIYKKALTKLGIDEEQVKEIPPKQFKSFVHSGEVVYGPSGLYSNKYQVSWLFFSDTEVYIYSLTFDMLSMNSIETCEEYFYKDITAISSIIETKETKLKGNIGCLTGNKEIVGVKEYSSLKIIVPGDVLRLAMKNTPQIEQNIQAMKQKLREKKN